VAQTRMVAAAIARRRVPPRVAYTGCGHKKGPGLLVDRGRVCHVDANRPAQHGSVSGESVSHQPVAVLSSSWPRRAYFDHAQAAPRQQGRQTMLKLIAAAAFALSVTTSAQAMTAAPIHQNGVITQVAFACGPGRTRVGGVCVARTTIRHERRCVRWTGHVCAAWY